MKKNIILALFAAAGIFASSSCIMNQEKEVAADVCGCTSQLEKQLSPEFVKLVIETTDAPNPEQAMTEKLEAMEMEEMLAIMADMKVVNEIENDKGEFSACMNELEKKYDNAYTFDEEESMKTVLAEMQKLDCKFGSAILKLGMQAK
jgi:hypothetical protein